MDVVNKFTKMLDAAKVELENAPSFYGAHPDTSFFKRKYREVIKGNREQEEENSDISYR